MQGKPLMLKPNSDEAGCTFFLSTMETVCLQLIQNNSINWRKHMTTRGVIILKTQVGSLEFRGIRQSQIESLPIMHL